MLASFGKICKSILTHADADLGKIVKNLPLSMKRIQSNQIIDFRIICCERICIIKKTNKSDRVGNWEVVSENPDLLIQTMKYSFYQS